MKQTRNSKNQVIIRRLFPLLISGLFMSAVLTLSACSVMDEASHSDDPLVPEPITEVRELTLFMSRSALSGTDFEQYKLIDDTTLFVECGKVKGGRFLPQIQKLYPLEASASETFTESLNALMASKTYQRNRFDAAGTNESIFSPGKFALTFRATNGRDEVTGDITTSVDGVVESKKSGERALFELATRLRKSYSSSEPTCSEEAFYGIPGSVEHLPFQNARSSDDN